VDAPAPPADDGFATVDIDDRSWRSLTVSFPGSGERLQVLSTLAPVEARVDSIRRLVLIGGLLALVLTGLARGRSPLSPCGRSRGCRKARRG
jgi:hypothetical protein